jgi:polyisoprenoid-binding protein YceI
MKQLVVLFSITLLYQFGFSQTLTPVDASSKVHFVIKNFGIKTGGDFTGLKGSISFNPSNLATSSFNVSVDAKTVDTDNGSRDEHLSEDEYFDVQKYPLITMKSTKVVPSTVAGRYYMFANLTIKGVTKPVEFGFSATPKDGGYVFEGGFDINRRNFGVGGSSISMSDKLKVSLKVFAK